MRQTTKSTQIKFIIALLVLGVIGAVTCLFVRHKIMTELGKNIPSSEQWAKEEHMFQPFMDPDQRKMRGSGSIFQAQ